MKVSFIYNTNFDTNKQNKKRQQSATLDQKSFIFSVLASKFPDGIQEKKVKSTVNTVLKAKLN